MKRFLFILILLVLLGNSTCLRCVYCKGPFKRPCMHPRMIDPPYSECGGTGAVCAAALLVVSGAVDNKTESKEMKFDFENDKSTMLFKGCAHKNFCKDTTTKMTEQYLGLFLAKCDTCEKDGCNNEFTFDYLNLNLRY